MGMIHQVASLHGIYTIFLVTNQQSFMANCLDKRKNWWGIYADPQNRLPVCDDNEDGASASSNSSNSSVSSQSGLGDIADDEFSDAEEEVQAEAEEKLGAEEEVQAEAEEKLGVLKRKRRPIKSTSSALLSNVNPKARIDRKDKRVLDVADRFWHDNCQMNTNSKNTITQSIDGTYRCCKEHIQSTDTKDLYEKFKNSTQYLEYIGDDPKKIIAYSLFKYAKCHCVVKSKQLDCADTERVGLDYAVSALRRMMKSSPENYRCDCFLHKLSDQEMKESIKSADAFAFCLMCPPEELKHLKRSKVENPVDPNAVECEHSEKLKNLLEAVAKRRATEST